MSKGVLYILLFFIMAAWGFNIAVVKMLVTSFPAVTITSLRVFVAGLTVFILLLFVKKLRQLTKREWKYTLLASLIGVLGHHYFLAIGLTQTTASNAALILNLIPLVTSILAMLFLGDRFTLLRFIGIISGFTGVAFIVLNGDGDISKGSVGDFLVFGGVVTQAISFIFIKKATETLDSRIMTAFMLIIGACFIFSVSFVLEPGGVFQLGKAPSVMWIWFVASAVIATGIGHMLYNTSIHYLGPGESAIFINLTPFFSLLASAWLLNEKIVPTQLIGFVFIVAGVLLGTGTVDYYIKKRKTRMLNRPASQRQV